MSAENGIKIFPSIPHLYDNEGKVNPKLPNAATTVLFNDVEKIVMSRGDVLDAVESGKLLLPDTTEAVNSSVLRGFNLFVNWAVASNTNSRRHAERALDDFIEGEFPVSYNVMPDILLSQAAVRDPKQGAYLAELERNLGIQDDVPANFRVRFLFEGHAYNDETQKLAHQPRMKSELTQTFRKDDRNVFLMEFGEDRNSIHRGRIAKGLRLSGSFVNAYIFDAIYEFWTKRYKALPIFGLEKAQVIADSLLKKTDDPEFTYSIAVCKVLDELVSDGYEIDLVLERSYSGAPTQKEVLKRAKIYAMEGKFNRWIEWLDQAVNKRDKITAYQVTKIAAEATREEGNTNLFVVMGGAHFNIPELLPENLKPVSTAIDMDEKGRKAANDAILNLAKELAEVEVE